MIVSLGVLALGLALYLPVLLHHPVVWPPPATLLCLALAAVYGEKRSLYVPGYGALNLGECLYFGATRAWGPVTGPFLAAVIGLVSDRLNRKTRRVVLFNLGWSLVTFTLVGLAPGPLAVLAYALSAATLQALAQASFEGLPLSKTARMQWQGMKLQAPAVLALGALATLLLELPFWAVLMLIFPIEMGSAYVLLQKAHAELKDAQARLVAAGRQQALGVMAAGVAHEINNPLAAMKTTLHMLRRKPDDACIALLEKGLERCQEITGRMLVYARKQGPQSARMDQVLQDALLLGHLEPLRLSASLPELPEVRCEPGELVQVLTNLLTNARDAGARRVTITGRVSGSGVEVLFEDDGKPIPPEVRAHLFEPFFTTKPVGEGTGLGLFLSQGIARRAGGDLALVGPKTFKLTLQVHRQGT